MNKFFLRYSTYLLAILLIADLVYSFNQFYTTVLDGDIAGVILPDKNYKVVLTDPLGLQVLLHNKVYASPNRFSSHWCMYTYFRTVPLYLQSFTTPVNSIYLSCAIVKWFTQLLFIVLLSLYITIDRLTLRNFLLAAVIITPLFQTFGYNNSMGIIDTAITYVFFYALPLGLLLLFFLPFYKSLYTGENIKLNLLRSILLIALVLFLTFNGSITSGVVLVICPLTLLGLWYNNYQTNTSSSFFNRAYQSFIKIPSSFLFYYITFCVLCCYSLYIGMNNAESGSDLVSLKERFLLLPKGLYHIITLNKGLPVLLFFVLLNTLVIYFSTYADKDKLLNIFKWVVVFSLLYLLLLPLGGYRPYRPLIIRYDTFIPVTIALLYYFGLTSFTLLTSFQFSMKKVYAGALVVALLIFSAAEVRFIHSQNNHEREALQTISESKDSIVQIKSEGRLLTWNKVIDYHDSEIAAQVLQYWGVVKEKKYYYQK